MTALPTCTCNRKSGGIIVNVFEDNRNRRKRRGKGEGVGVGTEKTTKEMKTLLDKHRRETQKPRRFTEAR